MSLVVAAAVVVVQEVEVKKIMRWRKVDSTMKPYDCNGDMKRGESRCTLRYTQKKCINEF